MSYSAKDATGADVAFDSIDIGGGVQRPRAATVSDQTTPGTTDLYTPRYSRPCAPIHQNVAFVAANEAAGDSFGGLIEVVCKDSEGVAPLPDGTFVLIASIAMFVPGSGSQSNSQWLLFDKPPTTSAFADGVAAVLNAADFPKLVGMIQDGPLTLVTTGNLLQSRIVPSISLKLDTGGKFYAVRVFNGGSGLTLGASPAVLTADVRY